MYRLLIVDDEAMIVEGLKQIINWNYYQINSIDTATTYEEAIEKSTNFKPHIALVDVCIENKKGYDLISDIKKFDREIQFIMISGYDEFQFAKKAMAAGVKDYLLKPINKNELKQVIEKVIVEDLHGTIKSEYKDKVKYDEILNCEYENMPKLIRKVIIIVHNEYAKNLSLKTIADRFQITSSYLGQLFLKETNMKFSEYLMRYRMNVAKQLLETTDLKVSCIAEMAGYTNMNYFYTQFQACFQSSPSDFRK